jgi:hypothetical protein
VYIPYRPGLPVRTPSKQYDLTYDNLTKVPPPTPPPRQREPSIPQSQANSSYTLLESYAAPAQRSIYATRDSLAIAPSLPFEPISEPPLEKRRRPDNFELAKSRNGVNDCTHKSLVGCRSHFDTPCCACIEDGTLSSVRKRYSNERGHLEDTNIRLLGYCPPCRSMRLPVLCRTLRIFGLT